MKISIIIPSYNQEQYLKDSIESCLNQTIKPHEIIVVNDGSTDESLKVAKKYPVKVVNQVNKGLSSARNTGVMNATGDWILPLDADDILLPNALQVIEKNLREIDTDVLGLSFNTFGVSDSVVVLMENPKVEDFKTGNRIGYCSVIKKSTLLEVGGYNPKMTWGAEDYDLWFDLLKRGKVIKTIQDIVWLYRVKESSMWTETQKHKEQYMEQIKKNHPEIIW